MVTLKYAGHQQNIGDIGPVESGMILGTIGKSLRIEQLAIWLENKGDEDINTFLRVHQQNRGWLEPTYNGDPSGTAGEGLRIEAVQIQLTGKAAEKYDVHYQVHAQEVGWMNWCKNGEIAGTENGSKRLEAIKVILTEKGIDMNVDNVNKYIKFETKTAEEKTADSEILPKKSGKLFFAIGHGKQTDGTWDCGCVDGNYNEADLMFAIGNYAVPKLREMGITVVTDWDTGNDRNITYCVRDANAAGVDAYVSIHCDYNLAPSGTLPLAYTGSAEGVRLANCINSAVLPAMGMITRGVIQRTEDYELNGPDAPSCIFETGSIRQDIRKLLDAKQFGEAIARGIYDWF
ncbi:N-acetylmuramoyl-L-alanine amidase [Eubacteriaceae bacterium ES2]|nr:N-acetylmuramoyl-L-alanine amidase [Eubacteriaceae bacterium ES2]